MGRQGVRRTPEEQQAEGRQDQPRQRPGEGWLSLLQGSHPPGHEQGRHRPAGESLVDDEHLPRPGGDRLPLALSGQEQQDGGKDGEGQEKAGPAGVSLSPGHLFLLRHDLDPIAVRVGNEVDAHARVFKADAAHLLVLSIKVVVLVGDES